jgi:hypothetical protein
MIFPQKWLQTALVPLLTVTGQVREVATASYSGSELCLRSWLDWR